MEEKRPLLDGVSSVAVPHNSYRHFVALCKFGLLLVFIYLANRFYSIFDLPESTIADPTPMGICSGVPRIPLQTVFTMPRAMYKGLVVEQTGHNNGLTIVGGYTHLVHNPEAGETVARFDIRLVNKEDEDFIANKELLELHQRDVLCIKMHLTIETPALDALDVLEINIPRSNILFIDKGFTIKQELKLATIKANILFEATSIATLTNVQGDITANFNRLSGNDLTATTSQGNVAINITAVDIPAHMSVHATQGDATVILPDDFDPAFKVSALMGHITVAADVHPEKLHIERKGFSEYRGYYGYSKDAVVNNEIKVSAVMGDATLRFI
ncbi:hypothetical protein BX666DRAFT_2024313 [Dichotomocladium elegans]|nr:hypothetical protein BX666DRAFT_2024313 [Dichotomocladium elegans]